MSGQEPVGKVDPSSQVNRQTQLQQIRAASKALNTEIQQVETDKLSTEYTEMADFNPLAMLKNAETLDKRVKKHDLKQSKETQEDEESPIATVDAVTKIADEVQNRNPEMQKRGLLGLKKAILESDTPEQILEKVLLSYPDHFLADEAFDFLLRSTDTNTKIGANILLARELLNERYGREVRAGRNINNEAKEFARQGLGTPGALRDLYRDVTGNPREPLALFEELSDSFTFDKMKPVIQFMLHSLGSDMKSKGPSIAPAELQRLFTEVRSMQAILGVFRFFFQRTPLMEGQFNREGLAFPKRLTFEVLAKTFIKLLAEKYPSPDKILRFAGPLGIGEEILAQVIIFTQFRDAMRGTAPKLFKSEKHRQDLLMVLIETISELDDLLDEEEEEEEEEEKKKPGWNQKDTME